MLIVTNQDGPGIIAGQRNITSSCNMVCPLNITHPGNIAGRANITSPGIFSVHDI